MPTTVIRVEGLAKRYRLGLVGRTSLHEDLSRWWARVRGQPDPTLRIDQLVRAASRQTAEPSGEKGPDADPDHVWALRDVTFDVSKGEILGIIGRNGAGKSTLLKILSRVTAPTLGCVKVKGRLASLLEVGTGFHPELTGSENVFLNAAILGMRQAEVRRKLDSILAFAGVERFADTPVKRYSSGMFVRLAFAVAAHLEPDILIVDEVLAVGDAEFQKKCIGKMQEVAGEGRTVLFVSHNMAAVSRLCGRGLLLSDGRIVKSGTADEVIAAYLGAGGGEAVADLRSASRRYGTGEVRFVEAQMLDAQGKPCGQFNAGQRVTFGAVLERRATAPELTVSFHIRRSDGVSITHLISEDAGQDFRMGSERECVAVTVDDLRLYPGTYFIDLFVGPRSGGGCFDLLEAALRMDVVSGAPYIVRNVPPNSSVVIMPARWWRGADLQTLRNAAPRV
jgi:lipopolysaccharide transport system ATP-binding protein